jgi:hypothetical protein
MNIKILGNIFIIVISEKSKKKQFQKEKLCLK